MAVLNLLIVADDPLAQAGLSLMLAQEADGEVIAHVNRADLAEELADGLKPDVIIWDVGWEIPAQLPEWSEIGVPVIALLPPLWPDEMVIHSLWNRGVKAFLARQVDGAMLMAAAHTAVHHLVVLDNEIAAALLSTNQQEIEHEVVEPLTPREKEVLQLLAEGLTNKAIARQLHISEHTVKFHVNAIMVKLNAQSRTDAVVRATRWGILAL